MAVLTSANVRTIAAWTEGSVTGQRYSCVRTEVYNGTWGGLVNTMPATAFGLTVIEEVTVGTIGNVMYLAAPSTNGSLVYLYTATAIAPADVVIPNTTGGLYIMVKGY